MKWPLDHGCARCMDAGQRGTCARLRCYCGHPECWAFDSYYELPPITAITPKAPNEQMAKTWAERGEPTWLDR